MAEKLRYWIEGPILNVLLEGNYSVEDFLGLFEKAFDDPATPERVALFTDARTVQVQRSNKDVEKIISRFEKWNDRILCEAVVVSSDYMFGVTRQAASYAGFSGRKSRPFRDSEAAKEWITKQLNRRGIYPEQ